MFVQVKERQGTQLADLRKPGPLVRLIEQTQDHNAVFAKVGPGNRSQTLPASEFFALHREATPDEVEALTPAKEPKPA